MFVHGHPNIVYDRGMVILEFHSKSGQSYAVELSPHELSQIDHVRSALLEWLFPVEAAY